MNSLIKPLEKLDSFDLLVDSMNKKGKKILTIGVLDSQKTHVIFGVEEKLGNNSLVIASSEIKAREIYEDLRFFNKGNVYLYPAKDILFYSADVRSINIVKERFNILNKLIHDEKATIVISIEGLFDRITPKEEFEKYILKLETGDIFEINALIYKLIEMGFEQRDLVEAPGQFARRGGILDLFTTIHENAIRIEFWDNEIDSIRILDPKSQRSIQKIEDVVIFPMKELLFDKKTLKAGTERIKKEFEKSLNNFVKKGLKEESDRLQNIFSEYLELLEMGGSISGVEKFFSYFYEKEICLIDYLPENTNVFIDEISRVKSHSDNVSKEFSESIKDKILKGIMLPNQFNMVLDFDKVLHKLNKFNIVIMSTLMTSSKELHFDTSINFEVKSSLTVKNNMEFFIDDLKGYIKNNYRVIILSGNKTTGLRLQLEFEEHKIYAHYLDNFEDVNFEKGQVYISKGSLNKGFEYPEIKYVFLTDKEIFGQEKKKHKLVKKQKGSIIESFTDLRLGDYIVHDNHGIGVFKGIEKMITNNISKDYIKIEYLDGGNLYVPTTQLDMVQKYIGGDSAKPKMNKLGGQEWTKAKIKTKKVVEILAKDLLELYAKRESAKGFVYSKDTVWQQEFEDMFPYEETDDQIMAIEDMKRDMEKDKVMDRLICGDVGYGKTEVAIRGAFKAVQDGKQVAYLVPTTILAQQHYNTFVQRMKSFPIQVELMSRFRSKKEQTETIENLEKGFCDIVIGTHRLLSKDVKFKDLGLVIVDEEQRFGVTHKEKLKKMKENVDILVLTATPIPRTLHMSLSGIRDMSVLEEPPHERQPVQTYVLENDMEFIKDAIARELGRGGQVYYLYNRVKNISEVAMKIQEALPDAEVAFAHGQMTEKMLENIMKSFIDGEIDVLVCTTIIETGLDISNVNTIIIEDADTMGLSQLYQLRGRVGRSNRSSYAYLMYKKDKVLKEHAEKRLQTIRDFTEFGSGFKIAMRDLEIRGAGSLLGSSQHGHMDAIGYDLYCKLLDNAVKNLKGIKSEEDFETSIDISLSGFIPNTFIKNEIQKLEVYKKIAAIQKIEDFYDVQEEIEDRFGTLPKSVQNLLDVALLKSKAHKAFVTSVVQKNQNVLVYFKSDAKIDLDRFGKIVNENKEVLSFKISPIPCVTYKVPSLGVDFGFLGQFFDFLVKK